MFVIGIGQIKLEVVKNKILIGIYDILSFIIEPLTTRGFNMPPFSMVFPKLNLLEKGWGPGLFYF